MKRLALSGSLALLVLLVAGNPPVSSQEAKFEGVTAVHVPKEVRDVFMKVYADSFYFRSAKAMAPDKVEAEVQKHRDATGLKIDVEQRNFRDEFFGRGGDDLRRAWVGDDSAETDYEVERQRDDAGQPHWTLFVSRVEKGIETTNTYLIGPDDLPELDFAFVYQYRVRHPLMEERFSMRSDGDNFARVIASFCKSYGVEYSVAGNEDEKLYINVKNRSFTDCIQLAANMFGRTTSYFDRPRDQLFAYNRFGEEWTQAEMYAYFERVLAEDVAQIRDARTLLSLPERKEQQ